jgi:hypothetical protein
MEKLYLNLLKNLGFIPVNCLQNEENFRIIDYSVVIKPTGNVEPYGMDLVFGLKVEDREIWCYRYDYVYVVVISTADDLVVGELIVNDDWREEREVAKLKLFVYDLVFVGKRFDAIQILSKLLNEKEEMVERILFW